MDTVLLIRNTAPDNYGGAETYQLAIATLLKQHHFRPIIVTSSRELYKYSLKHGIKAVVAPYNKTQNWSGLRNFLLPAYFIWQKKLTRYYKKLFQTEHPTVINVQSRDDWIAATHAAKKLGIKVLWTDHMDFRSWALWNIDKNFKNLIGKKIIKIARVVDKIIFISDYEHDWFTSFKQNKNLENLMVIKNGAIDQFEKYKNIKPIENSFCYVGRIVDYKGIFELISAFKKVSEKHPNATLNLFGDGDIEKYQKLASSNSNIVFHGHTDNPLKAIAENEFFILPSYREGLSLSLIDATMMKKTIIVTNVGAASEVIENEKSGLLIQPKSTEAIVTAMNKVLEDKTFANFLAKNVRKHFETEFNLNQIFEEKMLPLYQRTKK